MTPNPAEGSEPEALPTRVDGKPRRRWTEELTPREAVTVSDRFWSSVNRCAPDECWLWVGYSVGAGYGRIYVCGKLRPAHVVAWVLHYKETFPAGRIGCHRCDNPPCVNPAHIWPGTYQDNVRDAVRKGRLRGRPNNENARKTHCRRGHPFSPENTRLKGRWRECIACQRLHSKIWRDKRPGSQRA